jgi:hydrogenase maturation protease
VNRHVVVLGVGNILWADEGFGVRCVEALAARHAFGAGVELVDGGTQGLALLPILQRATHLLLLDAVDCGRLPGTLIVARDAEVPRCMSRDHMSLHQAGMNDVLACLAMLGHEPTALTLIGLQPVELDDYGGSLTPQARAQVPAALELALAELEAWGVSPAAASRGSSAGGVSLDGPLALERYERDRPSIDAACRAGDERFLRIRAGLEDGAARVAEVGASLIA